MAECIKMPLGMEVGLTWGLCVRWRPASPVKKGAEPPIFGPCLLRPNGWMDQDATWYRGRPQPRRLCVRWGPSSPPKKGTEPPPIFGPFLLWPNGWMHQDATWYGGRPHRTLCSMETSFPSQKGGRAPNFWPMSIAAKRLDAS